MVPVAIVGLFFKDYVEGLFGDGLLLVGCMLLVTAVLLTFSYYAKLVLKKISVIKMHLSLGLPNVLLFYPDYPVPVRPLLPDCY